MNGEESPKWLCARSSPFCAVVPGTLSESGESRSSTSRPMTPSAKHAKRTAAMPARAPRRFTYGISHPLDAESREDPASQRYVAVLLFARAALPAADLHQRLGERALAVVAGELGPGPRPGLAELGVVDEQALVAALHREDEPGDRRVGDRPEGVADPRVDRVDPAGEVDVDLPVERGDQVGQGVV